MVPGCPYPAPVAGPGYWVSTTYLNIVKTILYEIYLWAVLNLVRTKFSTDLHVVMYYRGKFSICNESTLDYTVLDLLDLSTAVRVLN
eukprot:SAG11_NODE_1531_length_4736_cov_2.690317_6_plen_87_part_00